MTQPPSPFSFFACALLAGCGGSVETVDPPDPPRGDLVFSRVYGGDYDDFARAPVLTTGDHLRFSGHGPLEGTTDPGENRGLILEVDGDGELFAHHRLGSSSLAPFNLADLAVGEKDTHLLTGSFDDTTSLAGCPVAGATGYGGETVAKLDEEGSCLWATSFTAGVFFTSLDVGPSGEAIIAGIGKPGASLGGGLTLPMPDQGGARFYATFSKQGAPLTVQDAGGHAPPLARFVGEAIVVSNEVGLSRRDSGGGTVWSLPLAEGETVTALTSRGGFAVAAIQGGEGLSVRALRIEDGSAAWSLALHPTSALGPASLAASEAGVVLGVRFTGSLDLGGEAISGAGADNLLWALVDGAGRVARRKVVAFPGALALGGVAVNQGGDVWVVGAFTGSVDFGDGVKTAHPAPPPMSAIDPAGYDVFVARYH